MIITNREAIFAGAGLLLGGLVTGLVVAKSLDKKYRDLADEEIQEVKTYYRMLRKEPPYDVVENLSSNQVVENHLTKKLSDLGYSGADDVVTSEDLVALKETLESQENVEEAVVNVFENPEEVDKLMSDRDGDRPYVVSYDEYFQDHDEYDKVTYTYFEKDGHVVDERDQIIEDYETQIGNQATRNFGNMSKDNNIVYIRNDELDMDIELLRNSGSYSEVVLGIKPRADD